MFVHARVVPTHHTMIPAFTCPDGVRFVQSYRPEDAELPVDIDIADMDFDGDGEITDELRLNCADRDFMSQERNWSVTSLVHGNRTVKLILSPTASKLNHKVLHPYLFRRVRKIESLDYLASMLGAPSDWLQKYEQLVAECKSVYARFKRLVDLPDSALETEIHEAFSELVLYVASALGIDVFCSRDEKVIVGGILVRPEYDLRSETDANFVNDENEYVLGSEVKSHKAFGFGEVWYRGCRGVQIFSSLYALNCPTFLVTQRQWKIFIEDSSRRSVLTFPYNEDPKLAPYKAGSLMKPMGTTFIKALSICILAKSQSSSSSATSVSSKCASVITPESTVVPERSWNSVEKASSKKKVAKQVQKIHFPSFISGYRDGMPIYSHVRIVPQMEVSQIEEMERLKAFSCAPPASQAGDRQNLEMRL